MAHTEGDGGTSNTEPQRPAYNRFKSEPDTLQPPAKTGSGTFKTPDPFGPPQQYKPEAYTPPNDPSLQLPPIKSVEGYAPTLPAIPLPPGPLNGEREQPHSQIHPPTLQPLNQLPTHYLSPSSDANNTPAHAQPAQHQMEQPSLSPGERMMPGDKHRKEIKRRTKTGCLTCRKRRIKCDESHPVCRNCQKSKRECAGYEPLFRTQANAHLPQSPPTVDASGSVHLAPAPSGPVYLPLPHGYGPIPPPQYGRHHPTSVYPPMSAMNSQHSYQPPPLDHTMSSSSDSGRISGVDFRSGGSQRSDTTSGPGRPPPLLPEPSQASKRILTIDDLYTIGARDPPTPKFSQPMTADVMDQIRYMYMNEYGRGIDSFLETTWYTTEGIDCLLNDSKLCELFAGVLELFQNTKSDNYDAMRLLPLTESRLIWRLMCLARTAAATHNAPSLSHSSSQSGNSSHPPSAQITNGSEPSTTSSTRPSAHKDASQSQHPIPSSLPMNPNLRNVLSRLEIFEHLITRRVLPSNPLAERALGSDPRAFPLHSPENHRLQFWQELGHHVTLPPSAINDIEVSLGRLRVLLDMIENRDVIYSIAIVRRYGPSVETAAQQEDMSRSTREDQAGKLKVAKKFLEDEAAGKGTNQVVQRLCGMAVRSWASWGSWR